MKLFFQFFWMGISKLLRIIFTIIYWMIPIPLAIISMLLLNKIMSIIFAIILAIIIAIITYCILNIISHSIKAVKYYKSTGTDSLITAWDKTAIEWE